MSTGVAVQGLGAGSSYTRDIGFAIGIIVILTVLFLPLPAIMIDVGLAFSIAFAVLILMVSLWIHRPLEFSAFPTVLLIATMLRLSLNVATTRLILSNGAEGHTAAGHVIAGFANFVMGGDFVIGVVVFVILITVNFLVITKGATRIAEVGARFTLDAMPGKQMAIDADLNFVDLGETVEAACRRELEEETGLAAEELVLVGVYSDPGRDPRGPTVSIAFATVLGSRRPEAGDDAAAAEWVADWRRKKLAFDHDRIVRDAERAMRRRKRIAPRRPARTRRPQTR